MQMPWLPKLKEAIDEWNDSDNHDTFPSSDSDENQMQLNVCLSFASADNIDIGLNIFDIMINLIQ